MKPFLKKIVVAVLALEARLVLRKYKPRIIAITGSVGKTSTKDTVYAVLRTKVFVRRSAKSFNSEIGVPLTILGCEESGWGRVTAWLAIILEGLALIVFKNHYPRWLVLEVGADHPGDIKKVTRWLAPDCVVITRFGETPVHLEFFPSREALIEEKTLLAHALKPGGTLVLGADDPEVRALAGVIPDTTQVITYGFDEGLTVHARDPEILYDARAVPIGMKANVRGITTPQTLELNGVLGRQALIAALAGIAVGHAYNVAIDAATDALGDMDFPPGRMRVLSGLNNSVLIDDSYNASPAAVAAALDTLEGVRTEGRKIAVLGDMLELGSESHTAHRHIGSRAAQVTDMLITIGVRAKEIHEAAYKAGQKKRRMRHFASSQEAAEYLKDNVADGDIILIKGSQGVRAEHVTKALLADPKIARTSLVRQESAWMQ